MTPFVYAILLFMPTIKSVPIKECNRIRMGNKWYSKEILWSHIGMPYNLHIHKHTNTLVFSFLIVETYSEVDFQLAYYDLDTKDYSVIAGIVDGCSIAVDQKNDEIYLGGGDGIYKFNMVTKIADFYREKNKNIWGMFYRRNLFYISYPDQKLHMEIDDKFAKVKEFEDIEIDCFHITSDTEIIYANKTGLFRYNNADKETDVISAFISVRQISEDIDGKVYVCSNVGLFSYTDRKLEKVLDETNLHGVAFDRDNRFVVSYKKRIFRLIESNVGCIEDDVW